MFSLMTGGGYLQARKRQEAIADKISFDPDKKTMREFLLREERLQAYEEVNFYTSDEGSTFVTIKIELKTLFMLCVQARRARKTPVDYFEELLEKNLKGSKEGGDEDN